METEIGNQQASSTEVAWMAGMLEGDGHITMRFNRVGKAAKKAYILTAVEFVNTDKAIIEEVVRVCKMLGVNMYVKCSKQGSHGKRMALWRCSTHRMKSAKPLLEAMYPYLVGEKKQRAEYMLQFIASRAKTLQTQHHPGWNNPVPYTDEQIDLVVACKHLVTPWKASETIRSELLATQL